MIEPTQEQKEGFELHCYGCGCKYKTHIITDKTPLCPKCSKKEADARAKLHVMIF